MAETAAAKQVPGWHLHRRLYDWVLHWADTRYGAPVLGALAFAESSFFPVPPDVLLIALVLGRPRKAWRFATVCALASIVGGVAGYGIGAGAWSSGVDEFFFNHVPGFGRDLIVTTDGAEHVGLINSPRDNPDSAPIQFTSRGGQERTFERAAIRSCEPGNYTRVRWAYDEWDFLVVFTAGFTPLPYKVITITAGVFRINFVIFLVASAVSRSARFFLVAGLIWWAGPKMKRWIDRYFNWVTLGFVALVIAGILGIKYVF